MPDMKLDSSADPLSPTFGPLMSAFLIAWLKSYVLIFLGGVLAVGAFVYFGHGGTSTKAAPRPNVTVTAAPTASTKPSPTATASAVPSPSIGAPAPSASADTTSFPAASKNVARKSVSPSRSLTRPTPSHQASSGSKGSSGSTGSRGGSSTSSPRTYALSVMSSTQFSCFDNIVERESGWNVYATNPSSGAYGLVQALPGSKMASAGADWRTNGVTQIRWGISYMNSEYGSPCAAWSYWQAHSSY